MKEVKDRVITVRLTASEYERLKSTCGADQASISTVVRKTMLEWAGARSDRRKRTEELLSEVSQKLDYLIGLLVPRPYD